MWHPNEHAINTHFALQYLEINQKTKMKISSIGSEGEKSEDENLALVPYSPSSKSINLGTSLSKVYSKRKKKLVNEMHVEFDDQDVHDPDHKSTRCEQGKFSSGLQIAAEEISRAVSRAEEVRSNLDPKFPNFIKQMLKSHVCKGFRLWIPTEFSKLHLPKHDMLFTLENELGQKFQMNYIAHKLRFGGGWKDFAISHNLLVGDVLIFQLVEPTKFKVYIIRANESNEIDLEVALKGNAVDSEEDDAQYCEKTLGQDITRRKRSKSLQRDVAQNNPKTRLQKSVSSKSNLLANKSKNSDKDTEMAIVATPSSSSSRIQMTDVKSFDDFTIMVDHICIDSELPDDIREKYYKLCSANKSFLHGNLMEGLNSKLIAGMICEIVNIADSLKQCSLTTTCREEFSNWEKALESFESMGMSLGILRARIQKLVKYSFESEGALVSRKYMEAKLTRVRAEDEMEKVESKLVELKETYDKCGEEVKTLKNKAERYENKFREEVDSPW